MLTVTEKSLYYYKLYSDLLSRCDSFASKIMDRYAGNIACRAGCSQCCILKTVFPVEAYNIQQYIAQSGFSAEKPSRADNRQCRFLKDDRCSIYPVRPVICRTHGYPVIIDGNIDFCPENFIGIKTIESENILDLDKLNHALAVINKGFVDNLEVPLPLERISFDDLI
jgi:uncharacterized protein